MFSLTPKKLLLSLLENQAGRPKVNRLLKKFALKVYVSSVLRMFLNELRGYFQE